MTSKERIKALFEAYRKELYEMVDEQNPEEYIRKDYEELLNSKSTEVFEINNNFGGTVGFFIIGTGENCHRDCDYYIQDCYMARGQRNRGIMSEELGKYITEHKGKYCLYIINNNYQAHLFWRSFMKKYNCEPVNIVDPEPNEEDSLYAFIVR